MLQTDTRIGGIRRLYVANPKKALMNVPNEVRKCVVFLAYDSPADGEVLAGTGFFLGVQDSGCLFPYLVTAAHVIEGIKEKGFSEIYVRVNMKAGGVERVRTEAEQWLSHPLDPAVDVAVMAWPWDERLDAMAYPAVGIVTGEVLTREGLGIGDEAFTVGLYTRHPGKSRNIPIVRIGNIAAVPEEPLTTKRGAMDAFLVETRSIGGISGSPCSSTSFRRASTAPPADTCFTCLV
jgi:hypothetical protein